MVYRLSEWSSLPPVYIITVGYKTGKILRQERKDIPPLESELLMSSFTFKDVKEALLASSNAILPNVRGYRFVCSRKYSEEQIELAVTLLNLMCLQQKSSKSSSRISKIIITWDLLEIQILRFHPRPTKLEILG